jgi:hypothetical protein
VYFYIQNRGKSGQMTEKKKREKVNAEITAAHLVQFAREVGTGMTHEDAIVFLNRNGRAYEMWKHMMKAGEEYIKKTLQRESPARLRTQTADSSRRCMIV